MRLVFPFIRGFGADKSEQLEMFPTRRKHTQDAQTCDPGDTVFNGGPPDRLESYLGLIAPGHPHIVRRVVLAVALCWLPLVLLCLVQTLVDRDSGIFSFITDYGVHARFLVAMPLLVVAEMVCLPVLSGIVCDLRDSGIIARNNLPAFRKIVESTLSWRDSIWLECGVAAFAVAGAVLIYFTVPPGTFPRWHNLAGRVESAAGWWHDLVSVPLLLVLLAGWVCRLAFWTRFLYLVSRLPLRIIAAHPDRAGGLRFLGRSVQAFSVVALALGAIAAGNVANHLAHKGGALSTFLLPIGVFALVVAVLFAAPLAVFTDRLVQALRRGEFTYGALAGNVGQQFEHKWFGQAVDASALDATDFSSTTDLYSITSNAYSMRAYPLALLHLAQLVAAALIPFVPTVFLVFPPQVVFEKLLGKLL